MLVKAESILRTNVPEASVPEASPRGVHYQYDQNGNTTHDGLKDFVYNQNQRLIRAVENGKTLTEYSYNGNGQRVIKKTGPANTNSASSQNTVYHYDLTGKLIAETAGNGKMIAEYMYLNGQPLAMVTKQANNERIYYYHNDHLATPQKMTDASGTVVWSADYKPFGEATIDQTVTRITNNLRFPGQYFDSETGLHYNYFRDYNPAVGMYVEADLIGIEKGANHLYIYAKNNAIRFNDPLGLAANVEVCVRPLSVFPSWMPWWVATINHAYLQIGGWSAGFQKSDSTVHIPEDNPNHSGKKCWPSEKREDGTLPDGTNCKCATDAQIQNCIKNYAQQGSQAGNYPSYGFVFNNCGDWAISALSRCCLKGEIPYHWY